MRAMLVLIDDLYERGALGAGTRAGRRHQAGVAFAELHHRVYPSAGVSNYGPRSPGKRQEMTDREADWDSHLKRALWAMTPDQGRVVCDVCARGVRPAKGEVGTLRAALDTLADHWGLGW